MKVPLKKTLLLLIPLLLMNLFAYSQIELKPTTIIKNDTLFFSFTEWQFREVIKKKLRLTFLEKNNNVLNKRLHLINAKFKTLQEVNNTLRADNSTLNSLLSVKNETISNNKKVANNVLKKANKQNKILKISSLILVVLFLIK